MSAVGKIISSVRTKQFKQGGSLSDAALKALREHRARMGWIGLVVFVAVLAGVVIAAYVALQNVHDANSMKLAAGGLGLSVGAALALVLQVWKQWTQTGLLLILIEGAREDQIAAILDKLADKI